MYTRKKRGDCIVERKTGGIERKSPSLCLIVADYRHRLEFRPTLAVLVSDDGSIIIFRSEFKMEAAGRKYHEPPRRDTSERTIQDVRTR